MPLNVAVIGSGNIGSDLMFKIFRNPHLKMIALVGIDAKSDGLARARKHDVAAIDTGIEGLLARKDLMDQIFDATSAKAHEFDLYGVMDVAEDMIGTEIGITPVVGRAALVLGYAGVYSSFMRHAENASKRFGVPTAKILEAVGKRKAVGGQEDIIIECAIELAQAEGIAASPELVTA